VSSRELDPRTSRRVDNLRAAAVACTDSLTGKATRLQVLRFADRLESKSKAKEGKR
jgi:hypothetical protein